MRVELDEALSHQSAQGLAKGSGADADLGSQLALVEGGAGLEFSRQDALADLAVGDIALGLVDPRRLRHPLTLVPAPSGSVRGVSRGLQFGQGRPPASRGKRTSALRRSMPSRTPAGRAMSSYSARMYFTAAAGAKG